MSKKDLKAKAARSLERKILRAIEAGEFTPVTGYLMTDPFISPLGRCVPIGPCGCLLAAAASVCGLKGSASQEALIAYLGEQGVERRDALLLEAGYEDTFAHGEGGDKDRPANASETRSPYYQVGKRLRRFHPHTDGHAQ